MFYQHWTNIIYVFYDDTGNQLCKKLKAYSIEYCLWRISYPPSSIEIPPSGTKFVADMCNKKFKYVIDAERGFKTNKKIISKFTILISCHCVSAPTLGQWVTD